MTAVVHPRRNDLPKLGALIARSLRTCLRTPELTAGPLLMSGFFLVIYHGQLAGAAPGFLTSGSYIAFIVPLVLLTAAFTGGAIGGQLVVRDLESRYFATLVLTPTRRGTFALAPTVAGLAVIATQLVILIMVGALLGLKHPHGAAGLGVLMSYTLVAGTGFLLLALAAGLIGRNMGAVNTAVYIFFPLSFMTATFVPRSSLEGWMAVAADFNPLTYLLEAMRDALTPGWSGSALLHGGIAAAGILAVGIAAAWFGLRQNGKEVDR